MEKLLNVIVYGLGNGCLYGLIAIGYSMVYSIIGLINFAHGDVFMIGGFFALTMAGLCGLTQDLPLWPFIGYTIFLMVTTSAFCAMVNYSIYKLVYEPLSNAPKLILLVSAIGVSMILQNLGMFWGAMGPECVMGAPRNAASPKKFPDVASRGKKVFGTGSQAIAEGAIAEKQPGGTFHLEGSKGTKQIAVSPGASRADAIATINEAQPTTGIMATTDGRLVSAEPGVRESLKVQIVSGSLAGITPGAYQGKDSPIPISRDHLVIFLITIPAVLLVHFIVQKTRIGKAMRACEQDVLAARLMGVNPARVISSTFALGGLLAGAASVIACYYWGTVRFDLGYSGGLYAFTAAVVGGIGSIAGAMIGGLILGFARTVTESYFASQWVNSTIFFVLIIFLIFRPSGLLGLKQAEKV